ncbi:hypothetical protein [Acidovorax sp. MR-S7]|uniref:hypothetical protein n=1 Tax=Acidovorax sp. MR-S7 TaxID=1268622 RepID=UPI000380CFDD|nr:hypothetical protein [Acidovorax sp. MR-S7]GAD24527.1 hypothetical protein AVS7_04287 [Acidovorax sp. MR-S7]
MRALFRSAAVAIAIAIAALLSGCAATTTVATTPAGQAPVCQPQSALKAMVLWQTRWRADQKDVPEREAAAARGIADFFADATCFPNATVARAEAGREAFAVPPGSDVLLVLTVRELGPTVKLLSSAALIEGGTEVAVDVARYVPGGGAPDRQFSIHWRNGGPGVVKGVQSLPADLAAALRAGLQ